MKRDLVFTLLFFILLLAGCTLKNNLSYGCCILSSDGQSCESFDGEVSPGVELLSTNSCNQTSGTCDIDVRITTLRQDGSRIEKIIQDGTAITTTYNSGGGVVSTQITPDPVLVPRTRLNPTDPQYIPPDDPRVQSEKVVVNICTQRAGGCKTADCQAFVCGPFNYNPTPVPSLADSITFKDEAQQNGNVPAIDAAAKGSNLNLFGATCNLVPTDDTLKNFFTNSKGSFINTFRFGIGNTFSDFDHYRFLFPTDDFACNANAFALAGGKDRYINYLLTPKNYSGKVAQTALGQPYTIAVGSNPLLGPAYSGNDIAGPKMSRITRTANSDVTGQRMSSDIANPPSTLSTQTSPIIADYKEIDNTFYKNFLHLIYKDEIDASYDATNGLVPAPFECSTSLECASGYCDTFDYSRSLCKIAGEERWVPCGCNPYTATCEGSESVINYLNDQPPTDEQSLVNYVDSYLNSGTEYVQKIKKYPVYNIARVHPSCDFHSVGLNLDDSETNFLYRQDCQIFEDGTVSNECAQSSVSFDQNQIFPRGPQNDNQGRPLYYGPIDNPADIAVNYAVTCNQPASDGNTQCTRSGSTFSCIFNTPRMICGNLEFNDCNIDSSGSISCDRTYSYEYLDSSGVITGPGNFDKPPKSNRAASTLQRIDQSKFPSEIFFFRDRIGQGRDYFNDGYSDGYIGYSLLSEQSFRETDFFKACEPEYDTRDAVFNAGTANLITFDNLSFDANPFDYELTNQYTYNYMQTLLDDSTRIRTFSTLFPQNYPGLNSQYPGLDDFIYTDYLSFGVLSSSPLQGLFTAPSPVPEQYRLFYGYQFEGPDFGNINLGILGYERNPRPSCDALGDLTGMYRYVPKYVMVKDTGKCEAAQNTEVPVVRAFGWCEGCSYATLAKQVVTGADELYTPYEKITDKKAVIGSTGFLETTKIRSDPNKPLKSLPDGSYLKEKQTQYLREGIMPVFDLTDNSNWDVIPISGSFENKDASGTLTLDVNFNIQNTNLITSLSFLGSSSSQSSTVSQGAYTLTVRATRNVDDILVNTLTIVSGTNRLYSITNQDVPSASIVNVGNTVSIQNAIPSVGPSILIVDDISLQESMQTSTDLIRQASVDVTATSGPGTKGLLSASVNGLQCSSPIQVGSSCELTPEDTHISASGGSASFTVRCRDQLTGLLGGCPNVQWSLTGQLAQSGYGTISGSGTVSVLSSSGLSVNLDGTVTASINNGEYTCSAQINSGASCEIKSIGAGSSAQPGYRSTFTATCKDGNDRIVPCVTGSQAGSWGFNGVLATLVGTRQSLGDGNDDPDTDYAIVDFNSPSQGTITYSSRDGAVCDYQVDVNNWLPVPARVNPPDRFNVHINPQVMALKYKEVGTFNLICRDNYRVVPCIPFDGGRPSDLPLRSSITPSDTSDLTIISSTSTTLTVRAEGSGINTITFTPFVSGFRRVDTGSGPETGGTSLMSFYVEQPPICTLTSSNSIVSPGSELALSLECKEVGRQVNSGYCVPTNSLFQGNSAGLCTDSSGGPALCQYYRDQAGVCRQFGNTIPCNNVNWASDGFVGSFTEESTTSARVAVYSWGGGGTITATVDPDPVNSGDEMTCSTQFSIQNSCNIIPASAVVRQGETNTFVLECKDEYGNVESCNNEQWSYSDPFLTGFTANLNPISNFVSITRMPFIDSLEDRLELAKHICPKCLLSFKVENGAPGTRLGSLRVADDFSTLENIMNYKSNIFGIVSTPTSSTQTVSVNTGSSGIAGTGVGIGGTGLPSTGSLPGGITGTTQLQVRSVSGGGPLLDVDMISFDFHPIEFVNENARLCSSSDSFNDFIVSELEGISRKTLSEYNTKLSLISDFSFDISDDRQGCFTSNPLPGSNLVRNANSLKLFYYLFTKQKRLARSGIIGLIYSDTQDFIDTRGALSLPTIDGSNFGTTRSGSSYDLNSLFLRIEPASSRLVADEPITLYTKVYANPIVECQKCNDVDLALGKCGNANSLMCANGQNCTLPQQLSPLEPLINPNLYKCPDFAIPETCTPCSQKSDGLSCTFSYPDGTTSTSYYGFSDLSDATPDIIASIPKGDACCLVENLPTNTASSSGSTIANTRATVGSGSSTLRCVADPTLPGCGTQSQSQSASYTYIKHTTNGKVAAPIVVSPTGDPTADCGLGDYSDLDPKLCGGEFSPIKNYKVDCRIAPQGTLPFTPQGLLIGEEVDPATGSFSAACALNYNSATGEYDAGQNCDIIISDTINSDSPLTVYTAAYYSPRGSQSWTMLQNSYDNSDCKSNDALTLFQSTGMYVGGLTCIPRISSPSGLYTIRIAYDVCGQWAPDPDPTCGTFRDVLFRVR